MAMCFELLSAKKVEVVAQSTFIKHVAHMKRSLGPRGYNLTLLSISFCRKFGFGFVLSIGMVSVGMECFYSYEIGMLEPKESFCTDKVTS